MTDTLGPMPPPAPLPMPARPVRGAPADEPRERVGARVALARTLAVGSALGVTLWATRALTGAIELASAAGAIERVLEGAFVVLFALTFGWIAWGAGVALAGLLVPLRRSWPEAVPDRPVALVMPIYGEDPAATSGGLHAMAEGLLRGAGDVRFEIVVLSDTRDGDAWVRETAAFARLREELAGRMPVWYRRRAANVGRKAGNVQEFVRRFGARYHSMVVLDADSLMAPDTLVTLARRMAGDPRLGLLQTAPRLIGGEGPLARLQAFASRTHGGVVARGVAAWQGPDGNFWGHNAILRVEAFAEACGLPELDGRPPFGGHVLSHDFVEAAWMRRRGWSVVMDPELGGSYEEGPPTLVDLAVRDRRWMQGNLQHAALLGGNGLALGSRAHMALGIVGYLASPLWLATLVVGALLGVRAAGLEHRYFTAPHQLTPTWPVFDADTLLVLFVVGIALLLLPKLMGLVEELGRPRGERGAAGRICAAALVELVVSSLLAPVLMLVQSRQVLDVLRGRDAGWNVQNREGRATAWRDVVAIHAPHTLVGVAAAVALWIWLPSVLPWLFPVLAGLVSSIPLSRATGAPALGARLVRWGLLPEPARTDVEVARDLATRRARRDLEGTPSSLEELLRQPGRAAAHFALVEAGDPPRRGVPDLDALAATVKCADARSGRELLGWLTPAERATLLARQDLFASASLLEA